MDYSRGFCWKGRCVCAPGYGGSSCDQQARCHFWDSSLASWSEEGIRTLPSPTGSPVISCVVEQLPVNATEYAALWGPIPPPTPPAPPPFFNETFAFTITPMDVSANPVFHTVLWIVLLNIFTVGYGHYMKKKKPFGLIGKPKAEEAEAGAPASDEAAGDEPAPLALMGPKEVSTPKLSVRFEVEGEMATFNEASFLRRLATLVGVEDLTESANLSAGSSASTIVIDVEIACPDATTLVMAAKTLKKSAASLGLG